MKMSSLIRLFTDYIIQYGDRDVVAVRYNKKGERDVVMVQCNKNDETEYVKDAYLKSISLHDCRNYLDELKSIQLACMNNDEVSTKHIQSQLKILNPMLFYLNQLYYVLLIHLQLFLFL